MSVTGTPQLQPTVPQEVKGDALKSQRLLKGSNGPAQVSGIPTRVTSPPPVAKKSTSLPQKKSESAPVTPSIILERAAPSNRSSTDSLFEIGKDAVIPSGMRTPARGISGSGPTLETVQESSLSSTPAIGRGPIVAVGHF